LLAEGLWAIEKAFESGITPDYFFFCPELVTSNEGQAIVKKGMQFCRGVYRISEKAFRTVSEKDKPDGLLAIVSLLFPSFQSLSIKKTSLITVLDGIEIPGNVGTILRSVDGSGGDFVVVTNRRARLTHPKVLKASLGSLFSVPIIESEIETAHSWFEEHRISLYFLEASAERTIYEEHFPSKVAVVAGSERYGIHNDWYRYKHQSVSIPMRGKCDSLNVAIALSLALYQIALRQNPQR
jgi:TrmH family RNA methyltransferase